MHIPLTSRGLLQHWHQRLRARCIRQQQQVPVPLLILPSILCEADPRML
jgi:hypothetical protein